MNFWKQGDTSKIIPFYMVSSTDHVTPMTGKTLTVTISKNGGSFGAVSGTVAEVSSGFYKLTPAAGDVDTLGPCILLASATGCDPCLINGRIVAFDPYTSLTGSSIADAICDEIISSGHTVSGSLAKILYDLQAGLAAAASNTGSPVWVNPASLDSNYALNRMITLVRQNTNEPTAKAKYSDSDILRRIEVAFQAVMSEINSVANNRMMARFNIDVVDGSDIFLLPPGIDTIKRIARLSDSGYREVEWSLAPRDATNICGPGILLEGTCLRFDPKWRSADETLEILYVPNGDFKMHYGTADSATSTTVVLAATPTKGSLDTRENAYVGATLRIVSDTNGYEQERVITAYDRTTRTATVEPAFDPVPSGTITYEVLPSYFKLLETVVALGVALDLVAAAQNPSRYNLLSAQYRKLMRAARMQLGRREGIVGDRFVGPGY